MLGQLDGRTDNTDHREASTQLHKTEHFELTGRDYSIFYAEFETLFSKRINFMAKGNLITTVFKKAKGEESRGANLVDVVSRYVAIRACVD
jgi:hypothetical protein